MSGTALQRFGLASLARATRTTFDWRNWGKKTDCASPDGLKPSKEVFDRLIDAEIIPRLMLINQETAATISPPAAEVPQIRSFSEKEIQAFAEKSVAEHPEQLVQQVSELLGDGISHEDVLLRLLAPAARYLGEMWEDDRFDFTEVTIGLMKMHRVLQHIQMDAPSGLGAGASSPRIMLAPAEGEQHLFGALMVGELFARSGWRVRCEPDSTDEYFLQAIASEHFDVIGLSASTDASVDRLKPAIEAIRAASKNPSVVIMVGGPMFAKDVGLAKKVGADATAVDGVRAVVTAERIVHSLTDSKGMSEH